MPSTYSGNPGTSPLDELRFLAGDVVAPFGASNEEVNFLLAKYLTPAAAVTPYVCFLANRYSSDYDRSIGDVNRSFGQRAAAYRERCSSLQGRDDDASGGVLVTLSRPRARGLRNPSESPETWTYDS